MVAKNLHRRFRVRVVSRLEPQIGDADFLEERFNGSSQVAKSKVPIRYETFNLMKFAKVGCIHCFVSKNTINREVLLWSEDTSSLHFFRHLVKHLSRDGSGMRSQEVRGGVLPLEHAAVTDASEPSRFVGGLHRLVIVLGDRQRPKRLFDEKRVMCITRRMGLYIYKRKEKKRKKEKKEKGREEGGKGNSSK